MKIQNVKAWIVDLGNTKPYTIAYRTIDTVSNVFVEVVLNNGITGLGSANPSRQVVGEGVEECAARMQGNTLAFLEGRDIREMYRLIFEVGDQFNESPGARTALDIALHDAFTRYLGIPLVKFLGQKCGPLPTSVTIGIKNVKETIIEAGEYIKQGFSVLKVKLGNDLNEDIERIVKLREQFGRNVVIRVDANQGYNFNQTVLFWKRTLRLDIELIEQPMPASAVDEMRRLPPEFRAKLAADESLVSVHDAWMLAQPEPAAGIFNIKLMKCGGINSALSIARIARYAGADLFWGCNDESVVSVSAALHAAYSCSRTRYIDLDGSFDLANDPAKGGFVVKDGLMMLTDAPGLGVSLK